MHGGVSHVDTFDPKPKLTELDGRRGPKPKVTASEVGNLMKSPWSFRTYGQIGLPVSELFPHITEVVGMEQDMITLQDIFLFEKSGITESGKVLGRFRATGIRPKFYDRLKACGITLAPQLFQTVVEIN